MVHIAKEQFNILFGLLLFAHTRKERAVKVAAPFSQVSKLSLHRPHELYHVCSSDAVGSKLLLIVDFDAV